MQLDRILVIGSGAREHAIVRRLRSENPRARIFCTPGNVGIAEDADCRAIKATDINALVAFSVANDIELTVVGPEAPLIAGVVDRFEAAGLLICGPSAMAAFNTEGSKVNFKNMLKKHAIPTAPFEVFDDVEKALAYVLFWGPEDIVIKADGLAGGKGVFLPDTMEEAEKVLRELMVDGKYDWAGRKVIIEERLDGWECSVTSVTDGRLVYLLPVAQDYKRARDSATGPNTGGMGARTIELSLDERLLVEQITLGVVEALAQEECFYQGFLYLGFMMTQEGPMLLEANCRIGDPEGQVLMLTIGGNFTDLCVAAAKGDLKSVESPKQSGHAVCVVMTSPEYPEASERNVPILGIEKAQNRGALVFHAGTSRIGLKYSTGKSGRILSVVAVGETPKDAGELAYYAAELIYTDPEGGLRYRRDIGAKHHREHRG